MYCNTERCFDGALSSHAAEWAWKPRKAGGSVGPDLCKNKKITKPNQWKTFQGNLQALKQPASQPPSQYCTRMGKQLAGPQQRR